MEYTGTEHLDPDDYWDGVEHERATESMNAVKLNPHQFGDQSTLFHAPLGQPEKGVFQGNPHARLYRSVGVPHSVARDFRETGDVGVITDHLDRPGKDYPVDRRLGLHWQHDLPSAKRHTWGWGERVVIEADHPGYEHVMEHDHPAMDTVHGGESSLVSEVLPEVPIKPNAPMRVHAVHLPAPSKEQPQEYHRGDDDARVWNRLSTQFDSIA